MKKYSVHFCFDEEFLITFQHGENAIIPFSEYNSSSSSKDNFFKKIKDGENKFDSTDSFTIDQKTFTSIDDLINYLRTKGEGIRFIKSVNKEQTRQGEIDCENCGGTGESDKKDRYGEFLTCYQCDGKGKKKIWK